MSTTAIDLIATKPEVKAVLAVVDELAIFAANYAVTTAAQYQSGADDLKRVKSAQDDCEAERKKITDPLNKALKAANDLFRAPAARLAQIEQAIKSKLLTFKRAEEERTRERQRIENEKARKETERLQTIADKAAAKGQESKAEKFAGRAATVVAPVVIADVPKVKGLSERENWKAEILDKTKLAEEYKIADEVKIGKLVRALKSDAQAVLGAGVRVYNDAGLASGKA